MNSTHDRFQCPLDYCPWTFDAPPLFEIPEGATEQNLTEIGQNYHQAVQTALASHFETHPITEWVNEVARLRSLLLEQPPLVCLGCYMDRHQAQKAGRPLPQMQLVQLVTPQGGFCPNHVQITDGPVVPGRTQSGLWVGDGQVPPPMPPNGVG